MLFQNKIKVNRFKEDEPGQKIILADDINPKEQPPKSGTIKNKNIPVTEGENTANVGKSLSLYASDQKSKHNVKTV